MFGIRGQKLHHAYQIHHGIWLSVESKIAISSKSQNDWVLSAQHTSFSGQLPGSQETNCVELPLKTLNRICKPYLILSLTSTAKETFGKDYFWRVCLMLSTTMHLLSEKKKREKLHNEIFSILKPCDVWPFFVVKSIHTDPEWWPLEGIWAKWKGNTIIAEWSKQQFRQMKNNLCGNGSEYPHFLGG